MAYVVWVRGAMERAEFSTANAAYREIVSIGPGHEIEIMRSDGRRLTRDELFEVAKQEYETAHT